MTRYLVPLPRPARFHLLYGEPVVFGGTGNEDDATIASYVEQVRQRIASLIREGERLRAGKITEDELCLNGGSE